MKGDGSEWFPVLLLVWFFTLICAEPTIYPESVEHAEKVCKDNGGWVKIEEGYSVFSSVKCKNGAEFDYEWSLDWAQNAGKVLNDEHL